MNFLPSSHFFQEMFFVAQKDWNVLHFALHLVTKITSLSLVQVLGVSQ